MPDIEHIQVGETVYNIRDTSAVKTVDATLPDQYGNVNVLKQVIAVASTIAIPASGNSQETTVNGLTANHQLIRWNFSASEENYPPCDLTWTTATNSFTITNTSGETSETIKPVFAVPVTAS